jgi:hypothetical protein
MWRSLPQGEPPRWAVLDLVASAMARGLGAQRREIAGEAPALLKQPS